MRAHICSCLPSALSSRRSRHVTSASLTTGKQPRLLIPRASVPHHTSKRIYATNQLHLHAIDETHLAVGKEPRLRGIAQANHREFSRNRDGKPRVPVSGSPLHAVGPPRHRVQCSSTMEGVRRPESSSRPGIAVAALQIAADECVGMGRARGLCAGRGTEWERWVWIGSRLIYIPVGYCSLRVGANGSHPLAGAEPGCGIRRGCLTLPRSVGSLAGWLACGWVPGVE